MSRKARVLSLSKSLKQGISPIIRRVNWLLYSNGTLMKEPGQLGSYESLRVMAYPWYDTGPRKKLKTNWGGIKLIHLPLMILQKMQADILVDIDL